LASSTQTRLQLAMTEMATRNDERFMAAAIRLARRNLGRTGTNPSVGTLIVNDDVVIGRGITAVGGRPHAEAEALKEAGEGAKGATAYVTLEPCAHHGRTPPCAEALVTAGVTRVVIAASDPDPRVSGRGAALLRLAGIAVVENFFEKEAAEGLSGYLMRSIKKRPEVTLKLAISADGNIGRRGAGQVAVTGEVTRKIVHVARAEMDAIMIGSATALQDNPELTSRLPGMSGRSPVRIVVDSRARLPLEGKLATSALRTPVWVAVLPSAPVDRTTALAAAGCKLLACEDDNGKIALPELLEDLAAQGIASVFVEGGAALGKSLLDQGLVDRLLLFTSDKTLGGDCVASPVTEYSIPAGFVKTRSALYGEDTFSEYVRE
jgi:diaminohydroxyphosphoribosylaminopyrimidine deaminase / 5-amino-6-(5-phosphoribosylamino)uracil reductase